VPAVVKTASRRLRRWPSASLDRRCARRDAACAGRDGETAPSRTEKHQGRPPIGSRLWGGSLGEARVEQRLSSQENASQGEKPVGDAADGAAVRVASPSEGGVAGAAPVVVLGGDTRPMVDRPAQSDVRGIAHGDNTGFATALGDGRDTGQRPQRLIVASAERPRGFGKKCGQRDLADSRHGPQNNDVALRDV